MSAFERLLQSHLFVSGSFCQINWDNPIFLDRTGALIVKTHDRLRNWRGDPNGFLFDEIETRYSGVLSMSRYWVKLEAQEQKWEHSIIDQIRSWSPAIIKDIVDCIEVYGITSATRVGLRHQVVFSKYDEISVSAFNSLCAERMGGFAGKYKAKNQSVNLLLSQGDIEISLNVSFAEKQEIKRKGPARGFMLDFDVYEKLDTDADTIIERVSSSTQSVFSYFASNYLELVSDSLSATGISQ